MQSQLHRESEHRCWPSEKFEEQGCLRGSERIDKILYNTINLLKSKYITLPMIIATYKIK